MRCIYLYNIYTCFINKYFSNKASYWNTFIKMMFTFLTTFHKTVSWKLSAKTCNFLRKFGFLILETSKNNRSNLTRKTFRHLKLFALFQLLCFPLLIQSLKNSNNFIILPLFKLYYSLSTKNCYE